MLKPRHVVFVQYSSRFLSPGDLYWEYYDRVYSRIPGYVLPDHYMEIPHWIPQVTGVLPEQIGKSLYIATGQEELVRFASQADPDTVFLFSVMNCTLDYFVDFASRVEQLVVAGGYVAPEGFAHLKNVIYLNSVDELSKIFPCSKTGGPANYELFRGERCIPRFRLSDGCGYGCRFCSVSPVLRLVDPERLPGEVAALMPLDFELVYISDKSFGEAPNWTSLADVRDRIANMKPGFQGFTVQTTPAIGSRDGVLATWRNLGVQNVEVGLEICDDDQLARLGKPFRMRQMNVMADRAAELGIRIIPDLIFGIPGADYTATVNWIEEHIEIVPAINVSWLSFEHGNRGGLGLPTTSPDDFDQASDHKSWLTPSDRDHSWQALTAILEATAPGFTVPKGQRRL